MEAEAQANYAALNTTSLEKHMTTGLRNGYNQKLTLHADYYDSDLDIVEYLLTVNVAQTLSIWNQENGMKYSLFLEYPTGKFFKNAFVPYMIVGDNIFDTTVIHPLAAQQLDKRQDIRQGRLDLAVCQGAVGMSDFKSSVVGIELKGINPSTEKVFEDIDRLVLALTMEDKKFANSIQAGYCLHIKKLGGSKRASTENNLKNAMDGSINRLRSSVSAHLVSTSPSIQAEILSEVIELNSSENFTPSAGQEQEWTYDEVAERTYIVSAVLIKLTRIQVPGAINQALDISEAG
jgi:hypothetical protein